MKRRPENWHLMSHEEKSKFIMNQSTGVCNCTPTIGESCRKCAPLIEPDDPDLETILVTKKELKTFYDDVGKEWSSSSFRLAKFIGIDPTKGT